MEEKEIFIFSNDETYFFKASAVIAAGLDRFQITGRPVYVITVYLLDGLKVQVDRIEDEERAKLLLRKFEKRLEKAIEKEKE